MTTLARCRRLVTWLCLLAVALCQTGCNAVLLLGYLIGGPPAIEPDFHKKTNQSLAGKNKTALVFCYAPTELKWDNDAVDYELAKFLAYRLNANKIKVMDPDQVHDWLDKNKDWHKVSEIGAAFKVDYIVHIDLREYSLFEEHSSDLYRGRADAIIHVVKMNEDKKDGDTIYSKELVSRFPRSTATPAHQFSYQDFKQRYLSELANEIGILFYEHFAGDDFINTAL
ncbi:MAG: hypothetical protein ACT4QC_23190 [Planctomycetaceae bacterium]